MQKISLVIPAYNEEMRIQASLEQLIGFVQWQKDYEFEIILVIEKSTDRTLELALDFTQNCSHFRVIANPIQRGKGYAIRSAMPLTTGEITFFMDLDLSTPLSEVSKFIELFNKLPQLDILIGNRKALNAYNSQSPFRRLLGQTFNKLIKRSLGLNFDDTQCGFKAFRKNASDRLFSQLRVDHYAFDVELLLLAQRQGYQIRSVPILWEDHAYSKINPLLDSYKMLLDTLKIKSSLSQLESTEQIELLDSVAEEKAS